MGEKLWVKTPLAIFCDANCDGGIVIENGKICELVPKGSKPKSQYDKSFDASSHVVLPGLINTHHHFYQTLTRACPPALDKELFAWLQSLYPVWAHIDSEMLEVATELALAELLLSGCTTAADHHYIVSDVLPDAFERQVKAARKMGMRVLITRGSMSISVDDGGLPPASVVQNAETILADCLDVAAKFHETGDGAFIQIGMAPCSPFSVDIGLMRDTAFEAKRLGLRLHTHLAETHDENTYCQANYGCRPLELLDKANWLGPQTWLAHGIHFNDDEIIALGNAGTGIAHCPGSNLMLASGTCAAHDLEAHGVPVGIGVDGSASEDASNLIEEVRRAWQVQRLRYGAGKISHKDVLRWATKGSARCLGRDDIGDIALGKQADLAMFTLDELRFSGAHDPLAAIILCGAHRADRVMIAGDWKVVDGAIVDYDTGELMARHKQAALTLAERALI